MGDCVKLWLAWLQWEASQPSSQEAVQSVVSLASATEAQLSEDAKQQLAEWHLEYLADFGTVAQMHETEQAFTQKFPSAQLGSRKRGREGGEETAAKKAAVDEAAAAQAQAQQAQQAYVPR